VEAGCVCIKGERHYARSATGSQFASTENVFRDASNVVEVKRAITIGVVQGNKQSIKGFVTFAS
jgi:hypothetical protein